MAGFTSLVGFLHFSSLLNSLYLNSKGFLALLFQFLSHCKEQEKEGGREGLVGALLLSGLNPPHKVLTKKL